MADPAGSGGAATSRRSTNWKNVSVATISGDENFYRYVDTKVDGLRSEMKGEIETVMATVREAEAQRSVDYSTLATSLDGVKTSLPTKGTIWRIAGTFFGGIIALMALAWAIFDTGAAITGGFAESVLSDKEQQDKIEKKLDQLLLEKKASDDVKGSAGAK